MIESIGGWPRPSPARQKTFPLTRCAPVHAAERRLGTATRIRTSVKIRTLPLGWDLTLGCVLQQMLGKLDPGSVVLHNPSPPC